VSSVFKLDALAARCVDHTTTVRTFLFLVLLLCESFALGYNQVGVSAIGVVVGNVGIAGKFGVNPSVCPDALKAVLDVVLLCLGLACSRRSVKLALSSCGSLR